MATASLEAGIRAFDPKGKSSDERARPRSGSGSALMSQVPHLLGNWGARASRSLGYWGQTLEDEAMAISPWATGADAMRFADGAHSPPSSCRAPYVFP